MEQSAQTILRTLKKCEKKFEGVPGCLDVTRTILKEVAAFVPHVPLIIALRQKGLRERHWEAISAKTGKKVQPDESWTLQTVFELEIGRKTSTSSKSSPRSPGKSFPSKPR